jgi:hypothetical protein
MIEVFKTNVMDKVDAEKLIKQIHQNFTNYQANFDLDDCDLILRIKSLGENVIPSQIISLLNQNNYQCEVLTDDLQFEYLPNS